MLKTKLMIVGGKGANLVELSRIHRIHIPDGFSISAEAFKRIIGEPSPIEELLKQLSWLSMENRSEISKFSGEIHRTIEGISIPQDINEEITFHLLRPGENKSYKIRSSATAEDLPIASFAGQAF